MVQRLYLRAEMNNVTDLGFADSAEEPFEFLFKIQCTACRETHSKAVGINLYEKHEIQGSRGEASFVFKCGFCSKRSNIEINLPKHYRGYTSDHSGQRIPMLDIEPRGIEVTAFIPEGRFKCAGVDSGSKFSEVDLSEDEWYDYDDNAATEVSVTDVFWSIDN